MGYRIVELAGPVERLVMKGRGSQRCLPVTDTVVTMALGYVSSAQMVSATVGELGSNVAK